MTVSQHSFLVFRSPSISRCISLYLHVFHFISSFTLIDLHLSMDSSSFSILLALCSTAAGRKDESLNQTSASPALIFIPQLCHPAPPSFHMPLICWDSPSLYLLLFSLICSLLIYLSGFLFTTISYCTILLSSILCLFLSLSAAANFPAHSLQLMQFQHCCYFFLYLYLSPPLVQPRLIRRHCYGAPNK